MSLYLIEGLQRRVAENGNRLNCEAAHVNKAIRQRRGGSILFVRHG